MKRVIRVAACAVLLLLAFGCSDRHESITGVSETQPMAGKVILTGVMSGASAAGIEVRIVGTTLVATTDAEGRFLFGAAPAGNLEMRLTRAADGIDFSTVVTSDPAVTIELQEKKGSSKPPKTTTTSISGPVTAASSTSITLIDSRSHAAATARIDAKTIIRKGSKTVTAADIKVGSQAEVKATVGSDKSLTATEIKLPEDETGDDGKNNEYEGLITAVSASSITISDAHTHGDVTAAITDTTIIRKGNTPVAAADLKIGQRVHIKATANADNTLTANEIILQNEDDDKGDDGETRPQKEFEGTIAAVSSSSITIHDSRSHADVTMIITGTTVIRKGQTQLTAGDLKVDDRVHVKGTTAADGTVTATEIIVQQSGKGKGDDD